MQVRSLFDLIDAKVADLSKSCSVTVPNLQAASSVLGVWFQGRH